MDAQTLAMEDGNVPHNWAVFYYPLIFHAHKDVHKECRERCMASDV